MTVAIAGQSHETAADGKTADGKCGSIRSRNTAVHIRSPSWAPTHQEPQDNFKGAWKPCSPETVGNFSAVGYFFGRQLHQTLGVPVGLINNAWGGSAAEAWVARLKLAELREAQTTTLDALPSTGQAVIVDLGEGKDIHPKNKQDVAKRLARLALAMTYKQPGIVGPSPRFEKAVKDGRKMVLSFSGVSGGWRPFDVAEPVGFTIAGADKKFMATKAALENDGRITVWSDAVPEPVAVRYAWADNPGCNMYSANGLPLTPFRTDDFPGITVSTSELVATTAGRPRQPRVGSPSRGMTGH